MGTQVFMVAGGYAREGFDYSLTASTEVLTSGADTWVLSTPLPSPRKGLRGVTVDNNIFMTGGLAYDDDDEDILWDDILWWKDEEGSWAVKHTSMQYDRAYHAATSVDLGHPAMQFCTGRV